MVTQLIDFGWKRIKRDFASLHNKVIETGFLNNEENRATIASYQIDGTKRGIPKRDFLRTTLIKNHTNYVNLISQKIRMMIQGSLAPNTLLDHIGSKIESDIKLSIIEWKSPANAESTIKIKGKNDPLVASGLMWILVKYKVR